MPARSRRLAVSLLVVLACRPTPPAKSGPSVSEGTRSGAVAVSEETPQSPDTAPPADVSHGEAVIGRSDGPPPVEARLAAGARGRGHRIRLEMEHATVEIAPGVRYAAWTFGGGVPGPALHVRQGDTVDFTLINRANIPHSMDFHAAEIAPSKYYVNVMPGDSLHYSFVARVPGAFVYHCGTAPVAMHIANGMYGALVVDPVPARPKAREFVFVQSEFYLTPKPGADGTRSLDWHRLLGLAPDHVVFNGRADQYATHPIQVARNELIRIHLVNAGPNRISSFHVVGGIFGRAYVDGSGTGTLTGVQTVNVSVGGGATFDLRLREAGDYPVVTHAFADASKGAIAILRAVEPAGMAARGTEAATPR